MKRTLLCLADLPRRATALHHAKRKVTEILSIGICGACACEGSARTVVKRWVLRLADHRSLHASAHPPLWISVLLFLEAIGIRAVCTNEPRVMQG